MIRRLAPVLLALAVLGPAAASASAAAQVRVGGGTLFYADGDPGDANNVTIKPSTDGKSLVVAETGRTQAGKTIPLTSDGSCTVSRGTATCPLAGVGGIDVQTGDQADTVHLTSLELPGRLAGGNGADKLYGSNGDDALIGGAGADTLSGGAGNDLADYSDRTSPVTVSLDGKAGDGEAGENDNVATDVERVAGGSAGDTLGGSDAANTLIGNGGNDTLSGGAGNDQLDGGDGDDQLSGGAGDDAEAGRAGDDTLGGADGNDSLTGAVGNDSLAGGDGNDQLDAGDGDDQLDGGAGTDNLLGGAGTDTASYAGAGTGVRVTLNGKPDDGAPGEGDNVQTENLTGSSGDDVLIGDRGANVIQGGEGNDRLLGGAGGDGLDAGPGDDLVEALDGLRDAVACGDGTDGVVTDRADIRSDCESIKYRVLQASSTRIHLSGAVARIPVRCSPAAAAGCHGRITLKAGKRVLGRRSFSLAPGRRWVARVTLSRRARSLGRRKRLVTAAMIVRNRDGSGQVRQTSQTIRVGA